LPKEASQQNLLDCSWAWFGNSACDGGLDFAGFDWILNDNSQRIARWEGEAGRAERD
jgi:hypothetical protein